MRVRLSASVLLATVVGLMTMLAPTAQAASSPSAFGDRLVSLINQARQQHGLRALTVTSGTSSVAASWTEHLASQRTLAHNPNLASQLESHGSPNWTTYGENVGEGTTSSADDLFQNYMSSPEHRANILGSAYRYVGVGVVFTGSSAWNTLDFVDQYGSATSSTTTKTTTTKTSTTKTQTVAPKPAATTTVKVAATSTAPRVSVPARRSVTTHPVARRHVRRHAAVSKPVAVNPHAISSPAAATPQQSVAWSASGVSSTSPLRVPGNGRTLPVLVAFVLVLLLTSRYAKVVRRGASTATA